MNTPTAFDLRSTPTDSITGAYSTQQPSQHSTPTSFPPQHSVQVNAAGLSPYQQPLAQPPQVAEYFTANQWKDIVASSFSDGGLKRRWDNAYGMDMGSNGGMHKRSR